MGRSKKFKCTVCFGKCKITKDQVKKAYWEKVKKGNLRECFDCYQMDPKLKLKIQLDNETTQHQRRVEYQRLQHENNSYTMPYTQCQII